MKPKEIASYLAKNEGGKVQAKIGDKRTDVSNLADLIYNSSQQHLLNLDGSGSHVLYESSVINELWLLGQRRHKKKLKK